MGRGACGWACVAFAAAMGCGNVPSPGSPGESDVAKIDGSRAASKPTARAAASPGTPEVVEIDRLFVLPNDDGSGKKLTVGEIQSFLADPQNHRPIVPKPPLGLGDPGAKIPADNPMTRAKVELGRLLYFDPRLSVDHTISCASCHSPTEGFADADRVSIGIKGLTGNRQAPTVINRLYGSLQFWDGRAPTLEEQSKGPIQNPVEMGFTHLAAVERLQGVEGYRLFFESVFGRPATIDDVAKAIATFERTVLVGGAPNDYYTLAEPILKLADEEIADLPEDQQERVRRVLAEAKEHPMSEAALRGRALYFGKAECSLCHVGQNLTDEAFYNIGVGMDRKDFDLGRYNETKKEEDKGAFKTPTLRNVAATAPYMHDGSQKTLREVVDHYDKGGTPNPYQHQRIKKLNLTEQEKEDLVAFMTEGLTGPMPPIKPPRLP